MYDFSSLALQLLVTLGVAALVVTLLGDRAVRRSLRGPGPRRAGASPPPPLTVLKPVKGLDEGFADNLRSFMLQDYPNFEILVGAESASDPALAVARALAAAHPEVRMRVIVCPDDGGLNPKVSILRALSPHVRTDLVLISDSNVRVTPGYLASTAAELADPAVGLVTNLIAGGGELSKGAILEGLHLSTYVARALSFAGVYFHRACVVGKSMLFRLSDFQRLGGWSRVRDVLAEDYLIGHLFESAGFRVAVSPHMVENYNCRWPVSRFVSRHLRWGQMRRRISITAYLLEPLLNPIALLTLAVIVALAAGHDPKPFLLIAFAGTTVRLLADWRLLRRMRSAGPGLGDVLLCVPKDLLAFGMWVVAWFRRSIDWRGRRFLIGAGTLLARVDDEVWEPAVTPVEEQRAH